MAQPRDEQSAIVLPDLDQRAMDALDTANTVRRSVAHLARRLRGLRPDAEISGAKLSMLGLLHRAGRPLIAADIARAERLKPQSLTRIIAELDELGLIRRRPDDFDHRQVLIEITPRGQRLLAQNAVHQNAWLASAMVANLSNAERDLLRISATLLDRLADSEIPVRAIAEDEEE